MASEKKAWYKVLFVTVLILWVSAISSVMLQLFGIVPKIFIGVFGFIILAFISGYRDVMRTEKSEKMSKELLAIGLVACIAYIACTAFLLGRYVVRML